MPITAMETAVSNAERRALLAGSSRIVPRLADLYAALPAITGKMELEYEGELQGAQAIARDLIDSAAREIFDELWDIDELMDPVEYFETGGVLQISETASAEACLRGLESVPGLMAAVDEAEFSDEDDTEMRVAAAELLLEGLAAHRLISRADGGEFARARPNRRKTGGTGFPFDIEPG